MITDTLKFWGFKTHPFEEAVLEGDTLTLFINRTEELIDLEDALHNRITGVYGSLGVGKSTFLSQFASGFPEKNLIVVLVHLSSESAENLFREMLAEVLAYQLDGKIKVERSFKMDSKNELFRLEGTVAYSRLFEFEGGAFIKGKSQKQQTKATAQHDEISARRLLSNIIKRAKTPFVVVLDDFHNLEIGRAEKDRAYLPILGRVISTIGQHFNHRNVAFVITLDSEIDKHIKKARSREGGAFSFAIGDFVRLDPLNVKDLFDLIRMRLIKNGWNKDVEDFITADAFYALALCSDGHPRRVLRVLRYAMQAVARDKSKNRNKQIQIKHLEIAAKKADEIVDKMDLTILNYLAINGPTSASDENLEQATRIKRTSLRPRLEKLQRRIKLNVEKKKVGRTTQVLYSLFNFER